MGMVLVPIVLLLLSGLRSRLRIGFGGGLEDVDSDVLDRFTDSLDVIDEDAADGSLGVRKGISRGSLIYPFSLRLSPVILRSRPLRL